jgi:DNA repair photolyase
MLIVSQRTRSTHMPQRPSPKGRGSHIDPPNRFLPTHREPDPDALDDDIPPDPRTEFILEQARSIVTENDSPDLSFRFSINPYRGCEHGCAYCYARPYHEFLGYNAGLDFETKIIVKENAAELFHEFLARDTWKPETVALSGITDCYQPCERRYRLTRACLEVAVEAQQPMSIITKNAIILRDLDLLRELAANRLLHVSLSVTTLDPDLARSMEPRTSVPAARLRAIRVLADAGVPVRVFVAPIIPGLNDSEIPAILEAAAQAGAQAANWILLRLPLTVAPVFREWLEREKPDQAARVEARIREARGGKLNDSTFGRRMRGSGEIVEQIGDLFRLFARKHGLGTELPDYDCTRFRPPLPRSGQLRLF